jgi:hypothetical protein
MKGYGVRESLNEKFSEVFLLKGKPTIYKRKNNERGRWKQEVLERAINAVKEKATGINAASRNSGIASRTSRR